MKSKMNELRCSTCVASRKNRSKLIAVLIFLFAIPMEAFAVVPMPFRIGGTVTVNGSILTQTTDTGYTIVVSKSDGTSFLPVTQDLDGVNSSNWYLINVPIFDVSDQPGGAVVGDNAFIHVLFNGADLSVVDPVDGKFVIGSSGGNLQIDLAVTTAVELPGAPSVISASDGTYDNKVNITWSSVAVATSYQLFRCNSNLVVSCAQIASLDGTSYDDTSAVPGSIYYYRVKAANSAGVSGYSNYDTGYRATRPGKLQFGYATYNFHENAGLATLSVTRTDGSYGAASVSYTTANGTASAGSDYMTMSGTLNWADKDSAPKNISIPITNDPTAEGNELFSVNLSGASGSSLGTPASTTITIIDDDQPIDSCSGIDIDLNGYIFDPGDHQCVATSSITLTNTDVYPLARVNITSPVVYLGSGIRSWPGGILSISTIDPITEHYTKLDTLGNTLSSDSTEWVCIKDNISGLVWEVKTNDGGLRDKDWHYTWGTQGGGDCSGSRCDTTGYVQAVNAEGICGMHNWRLATKNELKTLVYCSSGPDTPLDDFQSCNQGASIPSIDIDYFPQTISSIYAYYWTATTNANATDRAWYVYFYDGTAKGDGYKRNIGYLRLVHD